MSAECDRCGSDLRHVAGHWPLTSCERCDLEIRASTLAGTMRVFLRGDGTRENMQAALDLWDAYRSQNVDSPHSESYDLKR